MNSINKKIKQFEYYCLSFYGKDDGLQKDFFNNNLTRKELRRAIEIRLFEIPTTITFDGDTIDREFVRDILFKLRDPNSDTEYNFDLPNVVKTKLVHNYTNQ